MRKKYLKLISDFVKRTPEYQQFAATLRQNTHSCQLCGRTDLELVVHHDPPAVIQLAKIYDTSKSSFENAQLFYEKHLTGEITVKVICYCCHSIIHKKIKNYKCL